MENIKYDQGYVSELTQTQKKYFRNKYSEKSITKASFFTSVYIVSIYIFIFGAYQIFEYSNSSLLTLTALGVSSIFVARQMRALENIVHFGSHGNFCSNREKNDLITNFLAAWPMFQDVGRYRKFHSVHHGAYGSHLDPCRARLKSIGVNISEISCKKNAILLVLRWMPSYVREFYRELQSDKKQIAIFCTWHGVIFIALWALVSFKLSMFVMTFWMVVMFGLLPILRSIAELSEHDYDLGSSVAATTFNNIELLDHLIFHPAGDAWHALHHLHPTVSWWKQGEAHKYLKEHDPAYDRTIPQRSSNLEINQAQQSLQEKVAIAAD